MPVVAIPFSKEGYLGFWKIVKMDESLYSRAIYNPNIVRIDGKAKENIEQILKSEKTRLIREHWTVAKAKADIKLSRKIKDYWKELSVASYKQGTITL